MPEVINKNNFSFDDYIYEYIKDLPKKVCFLEPNNITIFNYFITFFIIYLIYNDKSLFIIVLFVLFRTFLDILDGSIARKCDKGTKLGAKLDIFGDGLFLNLLLYTFYLKSTNKNIKLIFLLLFIYGLLMSINLCFNYDYLYENNFMAIFHDNTIISVPFSVLLGIYLINK